MFANFPPNTNPELFSIIGSILGYVLEDDFNSYELNSIGNFIILVGQFMLTTAAQQQLINYRYSKSTGSRIKSDRDNHFAKNPEKANKADIDMLYNFITKLQESIEKLQADIEK